MNASPDRQHDDQQKECNYCCHGSSSALIAAPRSLEPSVISKCRMRLSIISWRASSTDASARVVIGSAVIRSLTCTAPSWAWAAAPRAPASPCSGLLHWFQRGGEVAAGHDANYDRAGHAVGHDGNRPDAVLHHERDRLDRRLGSVEGDHPAAHDGADGRHPCVLERGDERSIRQQVDAEEVESGDEAQKR